MENRKGLASTIVIGIVLTVILAYSIFMSFIDLDTIINQATEEGSLGAALGATAIGIIVILLHVLLSVLAVIALLLLIKVIPNCRLEDKKIRVTNYTYSVLIAAIAVFTAIKMLILIL